MSVADEILAIYAARGAGAYFGECVSMREHGLQAAHFAEEAGAPATLVAAALLHDIGHLIVDVPNDLAAWTHDARHEDTGACWLAARFASGVSEPVRLHVAAKRYLCATNPAYFARLSPASVTTLELQGGPMSAAQARAFESHPHHRDAVRVRLWDDRGKVEGLKTRELGDYRGLLDSLATERR
ncbi:MAG: metal-dependent phosphohydrolase [Gammaproteobacteria bacterium]|nr:metal-dependent phosphohydrolase [Gammaproteobacteria bacterium]